MKKTFKAILCLVLCLALAFSLAACGQGDSSSSGSSSSSDAGSSGDTGEAKYNYTGGFDYSEGLTEAGLWDGITALDYVTLPSDYKGIIYPEDVLTAADEDVQAQIDAILQNNMESIQVTDRAVEDGDSVNIDYVGSVDGVDFEGGSTKGAGTDVTLGVTNYIDDFLEQLIGHKPGETFNVEVTFPDPYQNNPDLAGKDAVFVTTINHITEQKLPELTDAFVDEKLGESNGLHTVDELRQNIAGTLVENQKYNYVLDYLMANASVSEVPDKLFEYQAYSMLDYYYMMASMYQVDLDTFLMAMGVAQSQDEFIEAGYEILEQSAQEMLVLQAVAEAEGLEVSEDEAKAFVGESSYESALEQYGKPYVMYQTMLSKAVDLLLENAKVA